MKSLIETKLENSFSVPEPIDDNQYSGKFVLRLPKSLPRCAFRGELGTNDPGEERVGVGRQYFAQLNFIYDSQNFSTFAGFISVYEGKLTFFPKSIIINIIVS